LERTNEQLDDLVRVRTEDLTAANDEIQRFAYIVSHDLRAPLVNVMGFTSELEQAAGALTRYLETQIVPAELREAIVDDIPEALRFIRSSTSKMDRLINAILKLSREGRRVLAPEPLDMAAMLHNIVDSMQHQATSKNAVIEIGDMPNLIADRLAVEQIFTNVMDNALKYLKADRPGAIKIDGKREGQMVRYDITDNGRGIAERDYERVFELFRRAGDQTVPGEGIGLAHVRALVRRLGGSIECSSALDVGTTFTIRVPAVAQIGTESMA
jgi:signal transduction histidine kinase